MNPFDKIITATEKAILSRVKSNSLFAEYYNRSNGNKASYYKQPTFYNAKEIKDWQMAVQQATDPFYPKRGPLMRFYQSLRLDNHLSSVIDTRILRVQRSSFKLVNDKGEENEELKMLLERPWYEDMVRLVVGKTFQGTTLIEMFDTDDNGELLRVNEIPQTNFIAQKGIITYYEWDNDGVSYRDGVYKDYYFQVGGDWELGMMNELAMIVLAKKLGLGSWMSYIDKFGVPPILVTTDRKDKQRTDELFEMLQDFKSNFFAVVQGAEKFEIPNNYNQDGYKSFKTLSDTCDAQISKRVLGGTSLVDEKSFVGSALVQERVAADRYESDKLLFKHCFNTQIRQRLAKISSVYKDFETHTLVWDNQETLDINGYIDGVEKLSTAFDFDFEEIKKRTGLPITGIKQTPAPIIGTPIPDPQKKKPNASIVGASRLYYSPFAHSTYNIFAATWDAATERLANQLYNGEVKPSDLDKDLVLKNYSSLSKSAETAWGKGYYTDDITRQFRENLMRFSGAKANDLMTRLYDLRASSKNKESFIVDAKKMVALHNETYLNVEQKFAANSASTAKDFEQFVKDIDIYPCLTNRTMGDANVRDTHAENEGVTKRVEDWYETPPYDPGCRCWLEQTTDEPTKQGLTGLDSKWANNPYNSGCIFTDKHSYFESIPENTYPEVMGNAEMMKQYVPYNEVIDTDGGNKVLVNDFADQNDLSDNVIAAKKVADELNTDVYVRPHIESGYVSNVKNPEFGIGTPNKLGDLKTFIDPKNSLSKFITNRLSSCDDQGCKYAVLDITLYTKSDLESILQRRLCGELTDKMNLNITDVIVIRGKKVSKITRKQIQKRDFTSFLKGL